MFEIIEINSYYYSIVDQDAEVSSVVGRYEKELGELQNVVRQKQRFIDRIQSDKL